MHAPWTIKYLCSNYLLYEIVPLALYLNILQFQFILLNYNINLFQRKKSQEVSYDAAQFYLVCVH